MVVECECEQQSRLHRSPLEDDEAVNCQDVHPHDDARGVVPHVTTWTVRKLSILEQSSLSFALL